MGLFDCHWTAGVTEHARKLDRGYRKVLNTCPDSVKPSFEQNGSQAQAIIAEVTGKQCALQSIRNNGRRRGTGLDIH